MYAHTGEKPFMCSVCAQRFSRKDNLQTHMKDKHRIFKVQFQISCPSLLLLRRMLMLAAVEDIEQRYSTVHKFAFHIEAAHLKQILTCLSLQKKRVRRGSANYLCPVCGKFFMDKWKWSRHVFAHTGVKPFSCSVCLQKFSRKDHMQAHMKEKHNIHKPLLQSLGKFCILSHSLSAVFNVGSSIFALVFLQPVAEWIIWKLTGLSGLHCTVLQYIDW